MSPLVGLVVSRHDPQRLDGCEGVGATGNSRPECPLCLVGASVSHRANPWGMSAMANKITEAVAILGMTWWWIGGALLVVVVIAVLLRPHWFN